MNFFTSLPFRLLAIMLIAALFVVGEAPGGAFVAGGLISAMALADDGDDGGDDGDDDGGAGFSGASGGSSFRAPRGVYRGNPLRDIRRALTPRFLGRPAPRRNRSSSRAQPAPPRPDRAERELVALGLTQPELDSLTTAGFTVVDQRAIAIAGGQVARLRAPDGVTLDAARDQVRAVNTAASVDFNHFYRPEQAEPIAEPATIECEGPQCVAPTLIGWPLLAADARSCAPGLRIGLVDTAINPDHDAFAAGRIELSRTSEAGTDESDRKHGTAIAALLVGSATSRTPGLLPEATLVAADPFHRARGNDDRADVYGLVQAIDAVVAGDVSVLNMSLAGPANLLLEKAVGGALARGVVLVAAVGNAGPRAAPLYPAAYPSVIAVTAVDRNRRVYRRAVRGDHVDLAAPGVNVWAAASISGARPKTGTSFAAPFVTAAAALVKASNPDFQAQQVADWLTEAADDLGEPGRDPVFGAGLVDAREACGPVVSARETP